VSGGICLVGTAKTRGWGVWRAMVTKRPIHGWIQPLSAVRGLFTFFEVVNSHLGDYTSV